MLTLDRRRLIPRSLMRLAGKAGREFAEVPPELRRCRPREIRLTPGGRIVATLSVAFLAAAFAGGFLLCGLSEAGRFRRERIEKEGVTTRGEVVRLTRTRGDNPRYTVFYQYSAGGANYTSRGRVSRRLWNTLQAGTAVDIRYLPGAGEQSWIRGYEPQGIPPWVAPLVFLGLLAAAWGLRFTLGRQSRLLSEGRAIIGRVTHSKRGEHGQVVYYEFRLMSGATRTGHFGPVRQPPLPGAPVCVLYDTEDPAFNAAYPLSLVRPE